MAGQEAGALAGRSAVLLDHTWLERGALLEAGLELRLGVVGEGVDEAAPG